MLFNICGPHNTGLAPHLDAVTFRGVRIENTPVWLQNIMGKSGLFTDYLVKMAQVITWWYRGANRRRSPTGPTVRSSRRSGSSAPMWNRGVVVQNEMMYHRGDPVGPPEDRAIEGMKNRSVFGYDADDDAWVVTTDGDVDPRATSPSRSGCSCTGTPRCTPTWTRCKKVMDHTDDLTHERVVDTLLADMRGARVEGRRAVGSVPRRRLHPGAHAHLHDRPDDRLDGRGR